ncbi:MAG TPA: ABC transporter ATP-binding protein [Kineosporiaceae bacterium]
MRATRSTRRQERHRAGDPDSPTAAPGQQVVAAARDLVKVYGSGGTAVRALDGVDVDFERGSFTAIMGPSGSGKSTLLHCLAGLDTATSGRVFLGPTDLTQLSDTELTLLRRLRVGFVFQAFNLLPALTAEQNIALPLELAQGRVDRARVRDLAGLLGVADRLSHRPAELSGGQQQRVAIARALLSAPDVVVADEPTGNLDSRTGAEVLGLLRTSVRELGQSVLMVTHDPNAAAYADRVVLLADGRVVDEVDRPTPEAVLMAMRLLDGSGSAPVRSGTGAR